MYIRIRVSGSADSNVDVTQNVAGAQLAEACLFTCDKVWRSISIIDRYLQVLQGVATPCGRLTKPACLPACVRLDAIVQNNSPALSTVDVTVERSRDT